MNSLDWYTHTPDELETTLNLTVGRNGALEGIKKES